MARPKAVSTRANRIQSASLERRERQKRDLRQAILEAAGKEFLEHGYESFSLRRVAERIGYSATTIYLYFQNKDDLLLATVQDGFRNFDRTLETAAATTPDPLERIEILGRTYIEFGLKNPELYRLMFMQRSDFYFMPKLVGSGSSEEALERARQNEGLEPTHHVIAQELLVQAVRDAMAANKICQGDPLIIADSLWASAHGLVALSNSPLMSADHAARVTDQLLKLLITGLTEKGPKAAC
jgi:AcrR family transcriptional regulator